MGVGWIWDSPGGLSPPTSPGYVECLRYIQINTDDHQ